MWLKKVVEGLEYKEKGICEEWEVSHRHRVQFLVPKPGFEVERNVFFRGSLRTPIFVGLRPMWG